MKSVMTHSFSQVPDVGIPRSAFDRSAGRTTAFDAGYLVPIFWDEALPGDTFSLQPHMFGRLATPIFPVMDNLRVDTFWFAVPNRLLWDNWQKFNGEQTNPGDSIDYTVPQVTTPGGGFSVGDIFDHFGLPPGVSNLSVQSLPLRAYNLIWNEWFRDENLQNSVTVPTGDGPDASTTFQLLRRGKRHDYFTSALPWPQKGDSVQLPLGTSAPVTGIGPTNQTYTAGPTNVYETDGTGTVAYANYKDPTTSTVRIEEDPNNSGFPNIRADLSNATAATINQLRQAFQIQKLLERDARGGTRYIEIIRSHFGVVSPDARVQRPEYLGGSSQPIQVTPIGQTSSTDATTPQGNLAAMGTFSGHNGGFTKSFTEHCQVIGLAMVRADLRYQQGINRAWSRSTRYDYYWPALAHIGEQAILNKEIYAQGTSADDDVFGYQERYAEYRYKPSEITGIMRSTAAGSLDAWHLAQEFTSLPALNSSFIEEDPPIDRVIAVNTEPHVIVDFYFSCRAARPMPLFGVPGLIDHF